MANRAHGFTLIEIMIAMGIASILFAISLPITFEFYQNYQIASERDTVLSLLREARSQAMINLGNTNHGLYISPTAYTVFQGTSYATRSTALDQTHPRTKAITITGSTEIIFNARSGQTSASIISFSYGTHIYKINVNSEGMVDWEL